jgi:putative ABC transport system substrate-binding protein
VTPLFAEGNPDLLPTYAEQLVAADSDVLMAIDTPAARALERITSVIPIVELVCHVYNEQGNTTGLTDDLSNGLIDRRLSMMLELLAFNNRPVRSVAVLWNHSNPASTTEVEELQAFCEAQHPPIALNALDVSAPDYDFAGAFARRGDATALILMEDPVVVQHRYDVLELAERFALPVMYETRVFVDGGGLMSYGMDRPAAFHRIADFVDEIVQHGLSRGCLPPPKAMPSGLFINPASARNLGLRLPEPPILCGVPAEYTGALSDPERLAMQSTNGSSTLRGV